MSLVFFHGNKGGVGKSMACEAFISIKMKYGELPRVVESDTQNPDVYRTFKSHLSAHRYNLRDDKNWSDLVSLVERETNDVVVSLPAGIGESIKRYRGFLAKDFEALNQDIYVYFLINTQYDSVQALHNAYRDLSKKCRFIVVKNEFFGKRNQFDMFDNSEIKKKLLDNGHEIVSFPVLSKFVADELIGVKEPWHMYQSSKSTVNTRIEYWFEMVEALFFGKKGEAVSLMDIVDEDDIWEEA